MKKNYQLKKRMRSNCVFACLFIITGSIFGLIYNTFLSHKEFESYFTIENSYRVDNTQFNSIKDFLFLEDTIDEISSFIKLNYSINLSNKDIEKSINVKKSEIRDTEFVLYFKNSIAKIIQPTLNYFSIYLIESLNSNHPLTFYLAVTSKPSNLKYINKIMKEITMSVIINSSIGLIVISIIKKVDGRIHDIKDIKQIESSIYEV